MHFSLLFLKDLIQQTVSRLISLLDVVALTSWSPLWRLPGAEPAVAQTDVLCYVRVFIVNLVVTFRKTTGIWPDVLMLLTAVGSIMVLYELLEMQATYWVSVAFIVAEYISVVWSPDRRRQRRLWTHNATFRISRLVRNPFQRSIRRSLLLPLINRRGQAVTDEPTSTTNHSEGNVVHMTQGLQSVFVDIVPKTSGHGAEKRILHIHCVHSTAPKSTATIVFLHQFGSGAFTWQAVMTDLASGAGFDLVAYDRVAHGLTFPSEPIVESRDSADDATPVGEDLSQVVNFQDAVNQPEFEVGLIRDLVGSRIECNTDALILVACGGAGARLAVDFADKNGKVKGLVLVSPYGVGNEGLPSVLRAVATAQVGRALVVSMAKSEVTEVLPRRSWEAKTIPVDILEAYKKAIDVPGWEDAMLNLLRKPVKESPLPRVDVPVLIIAGECDHFIADDIEYSRLAARFPRSTVSTVPKCGASVQEENPSAVSSLIRQFITSNVSR